MKFAVRSILVAILLAVALPVQACDGPPPELTKHHRDLVADSSRIALARALTPRTVAGEKLPAFETIEVLKGEVASEFVLENSNLLDASIWAPYPIGENDNDFNSHREIAFWDQGLTRQINDTDCRMKPYFEPGETYLLFVDHPHWAAYELIRREDDLWLKAVRNLIADPSRQSGLSVTLSQWLSLAPRAFVVRTISCDTPDFEMVEVLLGEGEGSWGAAELLKRIGYSGSRRNCQIGSRLLALVYYQSAADPDYANLALFDIDNGTVDFSKAIDGEVLNGRRVGGTELEVIGDRKISLDELRERLSRERLQ